MSRTRYNLIKDADKATIFAGWTLYGLLLSVALVADSLTKVI